MSLADDEAAAVGFELGSLLRRYDRMKDAASKAATTPPVVDDGRGHDDALLTTDAVLVSCLRLVRYFVWDGDRSADEPDPAQLVPGWVPPEPVASRLRSHLERLTAETTRVVPFVRPPWPIPTILASLHEVAKDFAWGLAASDPEAARHFDHNIEELRRRLS